MNSKEIMTAALTGGRPERMPCAPHWWGTYKYEALGLDFTEAAWQEGEKLAPVYADFYERFKPDWFHLHIGTPRYFKDCEITQREGKSVLAIDPQQRALKKEDKYFCTNSPDDEEIVDFPDYLLGSRSTRPKVDLGSRDAIDEYVKRYIHQSADDIAELGYVDHVVDIVERYGDEVFVAVHLPSAVCEIFDPTTGYTGFEEGLMAFYEYPEGMRYLLERCYEEQLEWARAYAKEGAHCFIISEAYISPDNVNPDVYRNNLKDIHRDYFAAVEAMGMIPICDFWGDVKPILEDLVEINSRALMVEESKKQFVLDIQEIRERIGPEVCLFGNIDSITLLNSGTPEMIAEEVRRQAAAGTSGSFVTANGSPITMETPEANVQALIDTARAL